MKLWKPALAVSTSFFLSACGNPGGISDAEYASYKELGAPKILYSCAVPMSFIQKASMACPNIDAMSEPEKKACIEKASKRYRDPNEKIPVVNTISGVGVGATYNFILNKAKQECDGDFKVLDSKQ